MDPGAEVRAKIHDLLGDVEREHGGRRIRRLELEQRADHVAVYATILSHLREPPAYTTIVGTPVITGLYTILLPILVFAIFASSRHLVVGGDSAPRRSSTAG